MPFILPSGETIQIDYFNVINGANVVAEYLHEGKLLVTQSMPEETASIYASALSGKSSGSFTTATNELMIFEFIKNEPHIFISVDSFTTKIGSTHMEIDYLLRDKIVLSQRTTIGTVKAIAGEMRKGDL
jgi:hypothetical protein